MHSTHAGQDQSGGDHPLHDFEAYAELQAVAATVAVATRTSLDEAERAATLAQWQTQRRRRGLVHWLAVSCPFFGPVLVGVATAVWMYVLLVLARHLVAG